MTQSQKDKYCLVPRISRASLVAQRVRRLPTMRETWAQSLGQEDPLKKEMATYFSTLGWKIPWMEEPCRLQSMGSQKVGHDRETSLSFHVYQASLVAQTVKRLSVCNAGNPCSIPGSGRSPGEGAPGEGLRRLIGYSPWGHKTSHTTERLHFLSTYIK